MIRSMIGTLACFLILSSAGYSLSPEESLNNMLEQYKAAYNAQDAEKLASFWANDAFYMNVSTRESLQGREEIAQFFKNQFEEEGKETINVTIESLNLTGQDSAVEKGIAVTKGADGEERKSAFLADLINQNGTWLLKKVVEVEMQNPSSHYEELKEISWLVGNWQAKNELIDLTLKVKWDENKNFLKQNFSVEFIGQKDLGIDQTIGWDPDHKKIHSWMFDSDGGFGEGSWTKLENQWIVPMAFTLPDGRRASATYIYTKIDDNTFTFASEDREIEGKMLPSIQPIKIIKVQ